jgi:peroxiredoxin
VRAARLRPVLRRWIAIGWWTLLLAAGPAHAEGGVASHPAPRFEVRSLEGDGLSLDALLEKGPVLVDFWATWCKPCVTSLPAVERLWTAHRAAGLTVIAVSIDGPRNFAKVRPFARSLGLTFPVVIDTDGALARRFDVVAVPTSVLIAPGRRIAHVQVGYTAGQEEALARAIEALLPAGAQADSGR